MDALENIMLNWYGLGCAAGTELQGGDDNRSTAVVVGNGSKYLLREYRMTARIDVEFEVQVLQRLKEARFPTPGIVPALSGDRYITVDGTTMCLFDYVDGAHPEVDHERSLEAASLAARLHLVSSQWTVNAPRTRTDLQNVAGFYMTLQQLPIVERDAAVAHFELLFRDLLASASEHFRGLHSSVVHHDLHPGNMLCARDGKELHLIDFDESYIGPSILDIASLAHNWCLQPDGVYDMSSVEVILGEYMKVRVLSIDECNALQYAVQLFQASDGAEWVRRQLRNGANIDVIEECRSFATLKTVLSGDEFPSVARSVRAQYL